MINIVLPIRINHEGRVYDSRDVQIGLLSPEDRKRLANAWIAPVERDGSSVPPGWRPIDQFTFEADLGVQAVLCSNGEVHAAVWGYGRFLGKKRGYAQVMRYFEHSGAGLEPFAFRPLADLIDRPAE